MKKIIIAIGGGEIRNKTTLKIDGFIAEEAKKRAGDKRAVALFLGTASHDSMPYFNSFRKIYTSIFDIKADVALLVYGEMNDDKIRDKINSADCIYVGGGDTKFMLDVWRKRGIDKLLCDAYNRGVIISGLSAGAICWFKKMYTDYDIINGTGKDYKILDGLGVIDGIACPHYNERKTDFDSEFCKVPYNKAIAIENNAAVVINDGSILGALSSGGKAYEIYKDNNNLLKTEILPI